MFFCPQRDHCCFVLLINSQLSAVPAGFSCRLDLPVNPCSSWGALPGHSWLTPEPAARSYSCYCAKTFSSHFGNTGNMAEPLHMWRAESSLLLLFLLRLGLAGSTGSLRATPDSQSSTLCTLPLLWLCLGSLLQPLSLLRTQSWLGPPSSSTQTWLGALHITGQDGRNLNNGWSGWSPLCGSFSLPKFSGKTNKNLPRLVLPSLSGLSCISQCATEVQNSWKFSKLRWFFSFADQGNISPSDIFTASTLEQELMPCPCLCRAELSSHHHWPNTQWSDLICLTCSLSYGNISGTSDPLQDNLLIILV